MQLAAQTGRPLPPGIADPDAPELPTGLDFYLEAFYCLDTERTYITHVPAPIPYSAIIRYGKDAELEGDELTYFLDVIRRLDDWHVNSTAERLRELGKPKGNKSVIEFGPR